MGAQLKRWKGYFEISVFFFLAALTGAVYTHYYRFSSNEDELGQTTNQKFALKGITRSTPQPFEIHYNSPCFDDKQRQCKYVSTGKVDNVDPKLMTGMFMKCILMILQARKSANT